MPTIYEQIEEAENTLNLELEGDEDGITDNDLSIQGRKGNGRVRGQSGQQQAEHSRKGTVSELGGGGSSDGRTPGDGASHDESGTSPSDARTSKRDSGTSRKSGKNPQEAGVGTQKDALAPQEDGEGDDGRVRGQRGQDDGSVEEAEDKPEKPLTNADWARLRREKRELEAKLKKIETERTTPAAPAAETKPSVVPEKPAEKSAEPDKNVNYQAWLEWKLEQNDLTIKEQNKVAEDYKTWKADQTKERETQTAINNAVQEFQSLEENYQQKNPDYLNAMEFARNKYAEALKITNPQMTAKQIDSKIDYDILAFASQKSAAGLNPAEELYDMAMERFGYQKKEGRQIETEEEAPRRQVEKPNLRMISSNKRRSASPLSGGGQGGNMPLTQEVAANMTMGEFSSLSPDELAQLENMG